MPIGSRLSHLIFAGWLLFACAAGTVDADEKQRSNRGKVVTYQDHVQPLLRKHCFKCHGNDEQKADLNLQNYAALLKGSSGGAIVKSGAPGNSRLLQVLTASDKSERMPPNSPRLPEKSIRLIQRWVRTGLRQSSRSKPLNTTQLVTFKPRAGNLRRPQGSPPFPAKLPKTEQRPQVRPMPVLGLAANPWSPLVAVSSYRRIRLYDSRQKKAIGALLFEEGLPLVLRFSRDGEVLLAAGGRPVQAGMAVLFSVRSGKPLARLGDELDTVLAADITPHQRQIAVGGSNRLVKVYDTATGKLKFKLTKHTDWVTAVAFSPDGKQLASADRSGGLYLWDAQKGGLLYSLSSHKGSVKSLAWRYDSQVLASAGDDGRLCWWNVKTGFLAISHGQAHNPQRPAGYFGKLRNGVLTVAFARDGSLLSGGRDRQCKLWNASGRQVKSLRFSELPTQVAFSHDGQTLIVGDAAGQVHFRNRK